MEFARIVTVVRAIIPVWPLVGGIRPVTRLHPAATSQRLGSCD
jgi:hypothetical protein